MPLFLLWEWVRSLFIQPTLSSESLILIYSQVLWNEVWQRPQQYAWRASKQHRTMYCAPVQPHNVIVRGMKWLPRQAIFENGRNLYVLSPLIFAGHYKSHWINRANCWIIAQYIKVSVPRDSDVRLLTNTPFSAPVIQSLFYRDKTRGRNLSVIIYDIIDDFTAFEWAPDFSKALDVLLIQMADQTLTGTYALAQANPNATFVPCGVDYEFFAKPAPPPPDIVDIRRPLLGYIGTISERLDFELIKKLSRFIPYANIVFIGPYHFPLGHLPQAPNIHYLGLKHYDELSGYAQAFDAALIPFKISPATMVLNPVKTLEYMAAGVPVVAISLPDLQRFYSDVLYLARSHEDFIFLVEQALATSDRERLDRGAKLAKNASWDSMTEKITESLFPNGNTPIVPLSGSRKI